MSKIHDSVPADADVRVGVKAVTSDGSIKDRPVEDGPYDVFYVSPEQKADYGVKDNEELRWVRDPGYWQQYEKLDRVEQMKAPLRRGGMEARLVTTPEYDRIHIGGGLNGDLVLMAVPKAVAELQQSETDQARDAFEYGMVPTDEGFQTREEFGSHKEDSILLDRRMRSEHEYHVRAGMINPDRKNMTLAQADAALKRQGVDVAAKQEALRNGGYHANMQQEDFANIMAGKPVRMEAAARSLQKTAGKQVAMGNSGFPRNPNSPLSQAQRRGSQGS